MKYFNVLLPIAAEGVFTYSSRNFPLTGARVSVPFNNRETVGIAMGETAKPSFACKEISLILDESPLFEPVWLEFLRKISEYYVTPLGAVLFGVISLKMLASMPPKNPRNPKSVPIVPAELSGEQKAIADRISESAAFSPHLIHGVTGSGKTEIYVELIKRFTAMDRQVLYLVPEISLTPQLVDLLSARLGAAPSIFHSKLSHKSRVEAFWGFAKGESSFVVGARSALFIPSESLGMIILDEEHEKSYKQEETPAYHLRDMAVLYAKLKDIPIVLGSATPQIESYANAVSGKYTLHTLPNRIFGAEMPSFNIIDLKKEKNPRQIIAGPVVSELKNVISRGEQAIIFLNRKGYSGALYCKVCGALQYCPNCSVPYTVYKNGRLLCNYCGSSARYKICGVCGGSEVRLAGAGTERVEEHLDGIFPDRVLRIDADKVTSARKLTQMISDFGNKKADILVGTQFIAKGLHFPDVTFVGILGMDNILSMPDFRATERAYQLMTQISGRAGREKKKGIIHVQTMMPDHPLFDTELYREQRAFYDYELPRREKFIYPPYTKLCRLLFSGEREEETEGAAERTVAELKKEFTEMIILGPAKAPISKMNGLYRFAALVKSNSGRSIIALVRRSAAIFGKTAAVTLKTDRDPYYFM
jgi:primosomal protein N' (replication factor Y)